MPHLTLDYSRNLENVLDIPALCDTVRRAAMGTGVFPMAGIRVRAFAADHVSIADGDARHGYLDISVRLRAGRSPEDKARAARAIFDAAEAVVKPHYAAHSIALSLELREIDPDLSPKSGSIRAHLRG